MNRLVIYLVVGFLILVPTLSWPQNRESYTIVIKNHHFDPAQLNVPAGQKIKLTVDNQDPTAEEFESFELNREKIVSGNKKITVFIGPLRPGSYKYFGDFHPKETHGTVVAQ